MELTEDQIIEKYAKQCGHGWSNTLLPYAYEWTCFSCGFSLIKKNMSSPKFKENITLSID